MRPLRTRDDLIALVAKHAVSAACSTAISEDRVTVLGGFQPAQGFPCYIVFVRSKHGRVWFLRVDCDEGQMCYRVRRIDRIPWRSWIGNSKGTRPLIDGDCPKVCAFARMIARRKRDPITAEEVATERCAPLLTDPLRSGYYRRNRGELGPRG